MRSKLLLALILIAVSIFVYLNSLNNAFVSDDAGILRNVGTNFSSLQGGIHSILYKIGGHNPLFFRLTTVLFHAASTTLVFFILLLFFGVGTSFLAALLFAVHPIHVEAVAWVSGGGYVIGGFFFLLSLFLYIKSVKQLVWYIPSLVSFLLAILFSPVYISLVLLFPLYEYTNHSLRKKWKKTFPFFAACLVLALPYIFNISSRLDTFRTGYYQDSSTYNPLFQIPVAISSYLELMFWPDQLTLYHTELSFSVLNFTIRVIVTILYFVGLAFLFKKNRVLFFWLSLFIISLLPTLTPYRVAWIVAERYVYIAMLSWCVAISYVAVHVYKKYRRPFLILIVVGVLLLTGRTIVRNFDWTNEDTLWFATARTSPSSWVNHNNLGDVYARRGEYDKSIKEFETAIAMNPNYADAYNNMANVLVKVERKGEARWAYEEAVRLNPNLWQAYFNLSSLYYGLNDMVNAEKYLLKSIELAPHESKLYAHLGVVYLSEGKLDKAESILKHALSIDTHNSVAQKGLAELRKIKHNP